MVRVARREQRGPEKHAARLERRRVTFEEDLAPKPMTVCVDDVGAGQIDLHTWLLPGRVPLRTASAVPRITHRRRTLRTARPPPAAWRGTPGTRSRPSLLETTDSDSLSAAFGNEELEAAGSGAPPALRRRAGVNLLGRWWQPLASIHAGRSRQPGPRRVPGTRSRCRPEASLSMLAEPAFAGVVPAMNRSDASRFSVPQQRIAPDHAAAAAR